MKSLARERDAAELLVRLRRVRPESARRWGRMSAHQMICHLADAFRVAIGEMSARDDATLPNRTVVKWLALYAPVKWPGGIPTSPELDQGSGGGTRPVDFASDVAQVETLLGIVTAGSIDLAQHPHPIFGRMSRTAWLRWGYLHVDHHLRQFGA